MEQTDLTLTPLSAKPLADAAHDLNEAARQYVQSLGGAAARQGALILAYPRSLPGLLTGLSGFRAILGPCRQEAGRTG